jgi:hypothetical protein
MRTATIDRFVKEEKKKTALKGKAHTKRGILFKGKIPIGTFDACLSWRRTVPRAVGEKNPSAKRGHP